MWYNQMVLNCIHKTYWNDTEQIRSNIKTSTKCLHAMPADIVSAMEDVWDIKITSIHVIYT